jgi:hypothetical protein
VLATCPYAEVAPYAEVTQTIALCA